MDAEKFIISGSPDVPLPNGLSFGQYVFDSLKLGGNAIALIDGVSGQTTTYAALLQKSVSLAVSLRRYGLTKGQVVCISSENRYEFTVTAFAVFYLGGVVSTLNITYTPDEMLHALNLSKPRIVFCSPLTAQRVKQVTERLEYVEDLMLFGNDLVINATLFNALISHNEDIDSFQLTKVDPVNDHLVILCSSGTTGLPKGVMLTHTNFLLCSQHLRINLESTGRVAATTTMFSVIPWFHAYGFVTNTIFVALNYKFVFALRFEEELFLRIIQDQKVTVVLTVPPLVLFLAKHPLVSKYDLSSLRELWCGAAPLSKELQEAVSKRLKLEVIKQGYGLTETTLGTLYDFSSGAKPGTAGTIVPGTKVKVVDIESGKALGPFKEGELCFKGPLMMKGYVGDAASTEQIFDADGWMHSGDIGYYDNDQYFYVVDRLKELIKYKGFQVPPAELEALLLQHEGIKDAAVIGLPDEAVGERPLAFVVKQPSSKVTTEDIVKFVASKVSPAKRLSGGVRFVQEIPKNPSGKILRKDLRNKIKLELVSKL